MRRFIWYLVFGFSIPLVSSCLEEINDLDKIKSELDISPKLAFPIIDSEIYFSDFKSKLDSFQLNTGEFGTIVLSYQHEIFKARAEDYFAFENQSTPVIQITGLDSYGQSLYTEFNVSKTEIYTVNNVSIDRLDSLRLKGGQLAIFFYNDLPADITAQLTIPGLTINGIPFQEVIDVSSGSGFWKFDLNNTFLDLTKGGTTFNEIEYTLDAIVRSNGNVVVPSQRMEVFFEIQSPEFTALYGEADSRVLESQTGTQTVNVFNNTDVLEFAIEEPAITVHIDNSFGASFDASLQAVNVKGKNGDVKSLSGEVMATINPMNVAGPTIGEIGQSVRSSVTINTINSNINELVSIIPAEIQYNASGFLLGGTGKMFVLDTSTVRVTGKVDLPLFGRVKGLVINKNVAFNGQDLDILDHAELVMKTANTFPLGIDLSLAFLDADSAVVEYIDSGELELIASPPVDINGVSQLSADRLVTLELANDRIARITRATSIDLIMVMNTSGNGDLPVRITENDFLKVNIGLKGKAKL